MSAKDVMTLFILGDAVGRIVLVHAHWRTMISVWIRLRTEASHIWYGNWGDLTEKEWKLACQLPT